MSQDEGKHVFVSYVREDNTEVDRLCDVLEAAKVPYWRDRNSLGPGDAWKAKIRDAIRAARWCSWPASQTTRALRPSPT
jgi:hypothetical protein